METATLQLPRDLIEAAIEKEVSLAMISAMGSADKIISALVKKVMDQKVDSAGKPTQYNGESFVKWVVDDTLRSVVQKTLSVEIEKYEVEIRQHIEKQLRVKNSPLLRELVDGMSTGIKDALQNKWRISVSYVQSEN